MTAQDKFGITSKKAMGDDKKHIGIGRVLKGSEILERISD